MIRRSRISKNRSFGDFEHLDEGFCHCNPTYDTFLESLGPWEHSKIVSRIFGHHQDDQEGQECPKKGVLEDFGCLDGGFVIVTLQLIPFWNPWDHKST